MRRLVWHDSFRRAFKKLIRNDRDLQARVFDTLGRLVEDPFEPRLKTHRLKGNLEGLWACWVEYDCRIIFLFERDPNATEDAIVLVDIGSHDEVY